MAECRLTAFPMNALRYAILQTLNLDSNFLTEIPLEIVRLATEGSECLRWQNLGLQSNQD